MIKTIKKVIITGPANWTRKTVAGRIRTAGPDQETVTPCFFDGREWRAVS